MDRYGGRKMADVIFKDNLTVTVPWNDPNSKAAAPQGGLMFTTPNWYISFAVTIMGCIGILGLVGGDKKLNLHSVEGQLIAHGIWLLFVLFILVSMTIAIKNP